MTFFNSSLDRWSSWASFAKVRVFTGLGKKSFAATLHNIPLPCPQIDAPYITFTVMILTASLIWDESCWPLGQTIFRQTFSQWLLYTRVQISFCNLTKYQKPNLILEGYDRWGQKSLGRLVVWETFQNKRSTNLKNWPHGSFCRSCFVFHYLRGSHTLPKQRCICRRYSHWTKI